MTSTTLRAVRLTAEAARRLRNGNRSGRVHSVFPRTVNIDLDESGHGGWVSLHGPGPIPAPFGIACEPWPGTAGLEGASVRVEADVVLLDDRLRISLENALLSDTRLPSPSPLPVVSGCLTGALARVAAGLLPTTAALLRGESPPTDLLARTAAPALACLYATTSALDAAGCLTAARALLGLGPGLTPSGDDCLVGWLAGVWTASADGRDLVGLTGRKLLALAADRTGRLSNAFLAAAVTGQAAEPLHRFALAPTEARLADLLALGATSGADLLAGYLLAHAALSEEHCQWL